MSENTKNDVLEAIGKAAAEEAENIIASAETYAEERRSAAMQNAYELGEALVLTYDGAVKIINPESGAIEASIPAIGPWSEKADWQEAGPSITVAGDTAYVTDAQASSVTVIDLHSRAVSHTLALGATPIEVAVVNGMTAEEEADQHDHAHG